MAGDANGPEPLSPRATAVTVYEGFKSSIDDSRRAVLDRHRVVDIGLKVVGVGSVGTRCLIILLEGRDRRDPLFLQVKEASRSVLEDHLPPSRYDNHGRRVVEGQRLIQAQSDIFLGWTAGASRRGQHDFYVRQLRDWKGSADIEAQSPTSLGHYAELCGHTLARGHARSGDAVAISAYAGKGDRLDRAVTAFAERYAAQNLEDFVRFRAALVDGRLPVAETLDG